MRKPEPSEFLVLPIKDLDLIAFFRGSDVSKPLYLNYREFIRFVTASISPASALLLQTNGTDNGSQTLLNLIEGSGITIADNGSGGITIASTGGGSITADNGLTLTGSNVQLGGTLIQDTTIANAAFNLKLTGNPTTDPSWNSIFTIEASGSGSGRSMVKLIGSGTNGIYLDNVLSAIRGTTASAAITIESSGSGDTHNFTPASAFIQPTIKTFNRVFASGTAVNGDFVEIYVRLSDPAVPGSVQTWYIDRLEYTDIAAGTAKYVKKIGSFVKASFNAHEIDHLGQHTFNEYGVGNFTGTAAYILAVDASGNIIEVSASGGSGTVTSVGLSVPSPSSPAFSVSGSPVTTNGTLAINALGSTSQYVRGDGSLATFPTIPTPIPDIAIYPYAKSTYLGDINPLNIAHGDAVNRLYLPASGSNTVVVIDTLSTDVVGTISITGPQSAYYIQSTGELIVTRVSASGLTRYNASTSALIATVSGGGSRGTDFIEYSPTKLFITNSGTNNLSVYNPTTNVFDTVIAGVGTFPFGICWNQEATSAHNGLLVITASSSNGVSIVNPATNTLVAGAVNPSGALSNPRGIAYVPSVDSYYVCSEVGNKITVLEPNTSTTFTFVKDIDGLLNPRWIRYSASTGYLYAVFGGVTAAAGNGRTFVAVIDPTTNTIIKVSPTSSTNTTNVTVHNLALDETNGFIYVNGYGGAAGTNIATQLKIKP